MKGWQDATEIYQIREYHIPDPVQMIHWKISAKAGNDGQRIQSSSWMCGMYQTLAFGCSERFQKLERMMEICASLSRTLVEEHCMHVVAWFDQKRPCCAMAREG